MHAAVKNADDRAGLSHHGGDLRDDRVPGRRTGMTKQHGVWLTPNDLRRQISERHRPEFAVDQLDPMSIVYQRPANAEQAKGR
jgi:hypothetical protein